jgi:hypothetical protein
MKDSNMTNHHGRTALLTLPVGMLALILALPTAGATEGCDRDCLRGLLDQYLIAVFKHKPSAAPLASYARATENAIDTKPGTGMWRTATGYGSVQRRYFDSSSSQAEYFGTIMEGDIVDIVALRLKVNDRKKITEAEWNIARKSDGNMFNADGIAALPPPPEGALAPADVTPREQMANVANTYFTGLEIHNGSAVPHIDGCERVENGFRVTNRLRTGPPPGSTPTALPAGGGTTAAQEVNPPTGGGTTTAQEARSGDCASGFEGFAKTIFQVYPRRYSFIDEQQGVVIGQVILHRPPGSSIKRNLLSEIFYTKSGKISAIYTAMYYLDPAAPNSPGW